MEIRFPKHVEILNFAEVTAQITCYHKSRNGHLILKIHLFNYL